MSVEIDIHCDDCRRILQRHDPVYCSTCAKFELQECCVCKQTYCRFEMFTKTKGLMCHHCAFEYESKLLEMKAA